MADIIQDGDSSKNIIKDITDRVNDLYAFKTHYHDNKTVALAQEKQTDIQNQLDKTIEFIKAHQDEALKQNRAQYFYLLGKAYNILENYSNDAEEALSKSIKLNPNQVDAWNELGECYWKNNDIVKAENCFQGALSKEKNKVSYRNLSMIARQMKCSSPEEREKNIEKGVAFAKAALELDSMDGQSWAVLGNAHFSTFFNIKQHPRTLKQAITAYDTAEKDPVARNFPDLHYNRAVVHKYEEEYPQCFASLDEAIRLDPGWEAPQQKKTSLIKYLNSCQDLVNHKGRLKTKKIHQFMNTLEEKMSNKLSSGVDTSTYVLKSGATLPYVPFTSLEMGVNKDRAVRGMVVCGVHNEENVPFTFCLIDSTGTCLCVTLYNLAEGRGVIIGDEIIILEPCMHHVQFTYEKHTFNFLSIRLLNPLLMIRNGKQVTPDYMAGSQFSTFTVNA
ncbi:tetratricopeptide repeat protein 5 isoform X4 [Diaphorina citri]|uniref:Cell division cycle protein 27 homolog n=1 Tax=Diaphorina citri TaxID=121845 RepID=A0A3Q0JKL5_DIACI|nr:tetratricopeptide repeat protein 5 isoform X1 [Diaphorina citri]XP_026688896.1 tetratricopeptide repeat protein 5 isoform X2 [Diaphorina citri]XP_026688898.1 tetratricopeptide repeat protein 5 isoform X3 [Diaphorina citri]XP_026688899.1 tetratricopeptide repeat protein 5 isoform X4 [Diaphorina citri]